MESLANSRAALVAAEQQRQGTEQKSSEARKDFIMERSKQATHNMAANNAVTAMNDRQRGFSLYLNRQPESACQNAAQRAGWRAANNAQGYADATAYLKEVQ